MLVASEAKIANTRLALNGRAPFIGGERLISEDSDDGKAKAREIISSIEKGLMWRE